MMSNQSTRARRVERELFETLSNFLLHNVGGSLPSYASITAVDVTPDLRNAKVFFRLVGEAKMIEATKDILGRERGLFQKQVARELKMKFCPVLRFEYGVAPHLDEVDRLLEDLRKPKHQFGD